MKITVSRLAHWLLWGVTFVLPFWFLPFLGTNIGAQKQMLLAATGLVLALLWSIQTVVTKRVVLSLSLLNAAVIGLAVATALSAVLSGPNTLFQFSGRMITLAGLALIALFGPTLAPNYRWKHVIRLWAFSGVVLSLISWLQLTPWSLGAWLNRLYPNVYPTNLLFSPAETPLVLLTFLLPVSVGGILSWLSEKTRGGKTALAAHLRNPLLYASLINGVTGAMVLVMLLTKAELRPLLLPFPYGWEMAVENFKNLRALLLGVGPENFLLVFHSLRNVSYNLLPYWMVRFGTSSSELLQVLVTGGLLGLAAWSGVLFALFQMVKKIGRKEPGLAASALIHMVLFFVLPFNSLLWITLGLTALAALNELRQHTPELVKDVVILLSAIRVVSPNNIKTMKTQAGFSLSVAIVVVALGALMAYGAGRVWAANVFFEFSRQSALRNEGVPTYQNLQKAIALQPNNTAYRRSYATTNLAIAQSLASKADLSDQERETLTQLIQQAIREARNAATLNPAETENWETLAGIYTNLLEIEGASEWASAANIQAIQTDPVSPALRLALGNLNLRLGKVDDALRAYEQAIQLKPDWVDAFGNYGVALEQKKELALALQSFQKARSLAPAGSEIAQALDERIAALQKQLADQQAAQKAAEGKEGQQAQLPAPTSPSVPSAPAQQSVPGGFEEVVSGEQPKEEATPQPSSNVVLPSDVGF